MPLLVYVIMPAGSDKAFESKRSALEASARHRGWATHFPLDPNVSHGYAQTTPIPFELSGVLEEMRAASLIVADLSLERPSCYYELGLAQALGRPTFVVAARETQIHQLAGRDEVRYYRDLQELALLMNEALGEHG
jgi:nucleoside 2-deoxyribosyltransferase